MAVPLTSSWPPCQPRWATRRQPERQTLGPRVGQIAAALGTPFMPWQQEVADVAFEIWPEGHENAGELVYREIRLTVPRQSGKTTLLLAVAIHRCLAFGNAQNVIYTAQNGVAARSKFIDEYLRVLERSPFSSMFRSRLTNGHEAMLWDNGSRFGITASTEKAGHGQVLDVGFMDEAFAYVDSRLEQAFRPAMNTRKQPQLWIVSTAGTPEASTYLLEKVTDGRERVDRGDCQGIAYFEWSAPEDADYRDENLWRSMMPALGHTTPIEAIRSACDGMTEPEFRRAFLNQWVTKAADDLALPLDIWHTLADMRSQADDPVTFAIDVVPDRSASAIGVWGTRSDGLGHAEVIDHRPGTDWVVARMAEVAKRWGVYVVTIDGAGPAMSLLPELQAAGLEVRLLNTTDVTSACAAMFDAITAESFRHRDQTNLNAAVAGAKRRPIGDRWAYGRKSSSIDISPIVAVTFARYSHDGADAGEVGIWFI